MMTKYPWTIKIIFLLLIGVGLRIMPTIAQPLWQGAAAISEALVTLPFQITDSRSAMFEKNKLLTRLLSEAYATVISPELTKPVNLVVSERANDVETQPDATEDSRSLIAAVVEQLETRIVATPLVASKDYRYLLEADLNQLRQNYDADLGDLKVMSGSYYLGSIVASNNKLLLEPLSDDNIQLSALLADKVEVPIQVVNVFTYQIKLPVGIEPPLGLFTTEGMLLGIKVNQETDRSTQHVSYQLPFQPRLSELVQVITLTPQADVINENNQ